MSNPLDEKKLREELDDLGCYLLSIYVARMGNFISQPEKELYIDDYLDQTVSLLQTTLKEKDGEIESFGRRAGLLAANNARLQADSQARVEGIVRHIEDILDLHEDEFGWIEISNNADYSRWQALKDKEGVK